jgi:hypothetical protein
MQRALAQPHRCTGKKAWRKKEAQLPRSPLSQTRDQKENRCSVAIEKCESAGQGQTWDLKDQCRYRQPVRHWNLVQQFHPMRYFIRAQGERYHLINDLLVSEIMSVIEPYKKWGVRRLKIDQRILDKARIRKHTYETCKDMIKIEIMLLHLCLKIIR